MADDRTEKVRPFRVADAGSAGIAAVFQKALSEGKLNEEDAARIKRTLRGHGGANEINEYAKMFKEMRRQNDLDTLFEAFKEFSRRSRKSLPNEELRKILETALDIEDIRRGPVVNARDRDLNAIFDMGRHLFERHINSIPARGGIGAPERRFRRRSRGGIGVPRRLPQRRSRGGVGVPRRLDRQEVGFDGVTSGLDDERLDAVIAGLEEAQAVSSEFGEALFGLEGVGMRAFAGLEGALGEFVRNGKFEWRGLADVAIQSIRDILNEKLRASGASSSLFGGGGGGFAGILGSLFQIGAGFLGPAAAGGVSSAALSSTALSLTGPRFAFAHGGRPPPGVASLVGEAGPELFIPDNLGTIVPNDRFGGIFARLPRV